MLDTFVNSTLDLYTVICKQLLPTPHKSHYTYNVRDLGKVFQGMLMMNPAKIEVGKASTTIVPSIAFTIKFINFNGFIRLTDYCNEEDTVISCVFLCTDDTNVNDRGMTRNCTKRICVT